jgi:hypothetical protein
MKELLDFKPEFDPVNKTLDFSGYGYGFKISKLYAIINVTQNVPLYVAGAPGLGISSTDKAGQKITLAYNTASHGSGDKLNIYYDTVSGIEANRPLEAGGNLENIADLLDQILREMRVMNMILTQGLNINDDLDALRNDVANYEKLNF